MATMREIKRRRTSIQNTQQITKAMKLVATVKLQKARVRAENSKAYFNYLYKTITSAISQAGNIEHSFITGTASDKAGIVVITSNRGLAGGYSVNVAKLIEESVTDKDKTLIYAAGKKGADFLVRNGYAIEGLFPEAAEEPVYDDAREIAETVINDYLSGKIGKLFVAYSEFKNTMVHIPRLIKLLPIEARRGDEGAKGQDGRGADGKSADDKSGTDKQSEADKLTFMNFEPSEDEAIRLLVPKYVTGMLYGAFVEAAASEHGARMQAMDSATNNASEIISDLELKYNRARQGAITQELTEIIAGADAIS